MRTSLAGLRLLREREGERLTAYRDSVGVWTIGVGVTRYEDGTPVRPGDTITAERSEELLLRLIVRYEDAVNSAVTVALTQPQFDALVSLAWNIGIGAFQASTLVKRLNAGDYAGAADEFLRWKFAGGQPILLKRRQAERAQFLSELPAVAPDVPQQPSLASTPEPSLNLREQRNPVMAPVLALLPSLVSLIPELGKLFGSGSAVAERNIAAAQKVAEAVVAATGAPNLQGAVETMSGDADARRKAQEAVQGIWYELVEVGGGIAAARTFNVQTANIPAWRMPAVWVSGALLLLVFMTVGTVLWGEGWSNDIRLQVVTAVLTIIGVVSSFWLGSSIGSARKTDILADK